MIAQLTNLQLRGGDGRVNARFDPTEAGPEVILVLDADQWDNFSAPLQVGRHYEFEFKRVVP